MHKCNNVYIQLTQNVLYNKKTDAISNWKVGTELYLSHEADLNQKNGRCLKTSAHEGYKSQAICRRTEWHETEPQFKNVNDPRTLPPNLTSASCQHKAGINRPLSANTAHQRAWCDPPQRESRLSHNDQQIQGRMGASRPSMLEKSRSWEGCLRWQGRRRQGDSHRPLRSTRPNKKLTSLSLYMEDAGVVRGAGRLWLSCDTVNAAGGGLLPSDGVVFGVVLALFMELFREVLDSADCLSSLPCAVAGRREFLNSCNTKPSLNKRWSNDSVDKTRSFNSSCNCKHSPSITCVHQLASEKWSCTQNIQLAQEWE